MKLIIEGEGLNVKAIKAEYTPVEWLVVEEAVHRYSKDRSVNIIDRITAQQILSAMPVVVKKEDVE